MVGHPCDQVTGIVSGHTGKAEKSANELEAEKEKMRAALDRATVRLTEAKTTVAAIQCR